MEKIRTRPFGGSGRNVTPVGLGGEGILRTYGEEAGAAAVIEEAAIQGIAYFDTAPAYSGSEGYYGTFWRSHPNLRGEIFQTSKSASRTAMGARADLDRTLKTLGLDAIDLWQIHDVRTRQDLVDRGAGRSPRCASPRLRTSQGRAHSQHEPTDESI